MVSGLEAILLKAITGLAPKATAWFAEKAQANLGYDATSQAFQRAYTAAFEQLRADFRRRGLEAASQEVAQQLLADFLILDDIWPSLLDGAFANRPPSLPDMRRLFEFHGGVIDQFPGGFDAAINAWWNGLYDGLRVESDKPDNPLFHRVIREEVSELKTLITGPVQKELRQIRAAVTSQPLSAPSLPTFHADIDRIARLTQEGHPRAAIAAFQQLRREHWHEFDARLRYRLVANLGNAYAEVGDREQSARSYIDAVAQQPDDPDARALEALAYVHLDQHERAFELASAVRAEHPNHARTAAIWARCAPADWPLDRLVSDIPGHLHSHHEVALAFTHRALDQNDLASAETYARAALKTAPKWPEAKSLLATVLLTDARDKWASTLGSTLPPAVATRVDEAIELLSMVLDDLRDRAAPEELARLRLNRAAAHTMLGRSDAAARDRAIADALIPDHAQVVINTALGLHEAGQPDRAIAVLSAHVAVDADPSLIVVLAQMLAMRNAGDDMRSARQLLDELLPRLVDAEQFLIDDVVDSQVRLALASDDAAAARQHLGSSQAARLSAELRLGLEAEIARVVGNATGSEELARQALAAVGPDTAPQVIRRIAMAVESLGWWEEALGLWERLAPKDVVTPDTQRLLHAARRAGADNRLLTFCRTLREHGVIDPECFDTELSLLERYHELPEAIALMEAYLANPTELRLTRHIRVRLALAALRVERRDIVDRLVPDLPTVDEVEAWQGRAVVDVLRHSAEPARGLAFAYDLWRRFPNEFESYTGLLAALFMVDGPELPLETIEVAGPGTAVKVREDDTGDERWWVIEDENAPRPEFNEVTSTDPVAVSLTGHRVGEQIPLPGAAFYPRTGTIQEILPKQVFRGQWCMREIALRFPAEARTQLFPFRPGTDPEVALEPIIAMARSHTSDLRRVEQLYIQGPLSIHTFASRFGKSVIDGVAYLAARPALPVHCCRAAGRDELVRTIQAAANASTIVLEPTALGTLVALDLLDLLQAARVPIVVPAGSVAALRDQLRDAEAAGRTVAHLTADDSGATFTPFTAEQATANAARLRSVLQAIETHCQVEPGTRLAALPKAQRDLLIQFCGQAGAEALALVNESGRVLWTDDFVVAYLASHELGVASVWTFPLAIHLRAAGAIDEQRMSHIAARLVAAGYVGTILTSEDFIQIFDAADWRPDATLPSAALNWLETAPLTREGLVAIATSLLAAIWRRTLLAGRAEAITVQLLNRLSARGDGERIIDATLRRLHAAFGPNVLGVANAIATIQAWQATPRDHLSLPPGTIRSSHTG